MNSERRQEFAYITGTDSPAISALRALEVKRYHVQGDVPPQTLAHHSARAAVLLMKIWPEYDARLTQAVLIHDIGEIITGDIPHPTKHLLRKANVMDQIDEVEDEFLREFLNLKLDLTPTEKVMTKVVDYLELAIYCDGFETRGARTICKNGISLTLESGKKLPLGDRLRIQLIKSLVEISETMLHEEHRQLMFSAAQDLQTSRPSQL